MVDAHCKRQPRASRQIAAGRPQIAHRNQQRDRPRQPADPQMRRRNRSGLDQPLQRIDRACGHHHQHRDRAQQIHRQHHHARQRQRARDGAARIADLATHETGRLGTRQRKGQARQDDHMAKVERRARRGGVKPRDTAEPPPADACQPDHDQRGQPHPDRTGAVKPSGPFQPGNVDCGNSRQRDQRKRHEPGGAARPCLHPRAAQKQRVAGIEIENRGKIRQVGCPVAPPRHEPCKRPEGLADPDVKPAFLRIARRQFDHRRDQRDVKTGKRHRPVPQRLRAQCGRRRDPAQRNPGHHVKQRQISHPHHAGWPAVCAGHDRHRVRRSLAEPHAPELRLMIEELVFERAGNMQRNQPGQQPA